MSTTKIQFKSQRAAKMAMTKAEKAYKAALAAKADFCCRPVPYDDESYYLNRDALVAKVDAAADHSAAVYEAANAQGFYVHSYWFGHNPTRDLIAANMD